MDEKISVTTVLGDGSQSRFGAIGRFFNDAAVVVHQMGVVYFGRDIEDEADRLGFQTLVKADIQPQGMVSLLQKLEKEHGSQAPEWLSSHPDIVKRIANIQTLIKDQPCKTCQSLNIDLKKIKQNITAQRTL